MEKLESKHVLPYVLYGVKMLTEKHILDAKDRIWTLQPSSFTNGWKTEFNSKIILRPLSDLTKPITHEGETFVPVEKYNYLRFDEISKYKGGSNVMKFIQVREQDVLLELHFDIYGLIDKNLAIDINNLNQ